jgi:hypothetical protein
MKFIPFSNLEPDGENDKPISMPRLNRTSQESVVSDSDIDRISEALEITRSSFKVLSPRVFWDDLVSQVTSIQSEITLEDVVQFLDIMNNPNEYKKWRLVYADAGGTYLAILESLELTNGFQHIHPAKDWKGIDVEDLYSSPRDPRNSRFLADLIFFAGKHINGSTEVMDEAIKRLDSEDRMFVDKFVSICYAYFSAVFYTMRFINPSVIDTWVEVFNLDSDPTPENIQKACQCWGDNPRGDRDASV